MSRRLLSFLHLGSSCWNFGQILGNLQLEYFFLYPQPTLPPKCILRDDAALAFLKMLCRNFQVFHRTFASFRKLKSLTIFFSFFTGKIDGRNSSLSSTYSFSDQTSKLLQAYFPPLICTHSNVEFQFPFSDFMMMNKVTLLCIFQ